MVTLGLRRAAPILAVRDLDAALEFYGRLGFSVRRYDAGYGYARRERLLLHLAQHRDLDPLTNTTAAWVDIEQVDALHAEWLALLGAEQHSLPRITVLVEEKPWRVREFSLQNPDNNLLRFGCQLSS